MATMEGSNSSNTTEEVEQRLRAFSLSTFENEIIDIRDDDVKASTEECQKTLFGKIVDDKRANLVGIRKDRGQIWRIKSLLDVRELGTYFFQFIFENQDDLRKVTGVQVHHVPLNWLTSEIGLKIDRVLKSGILKTTVIKWVKDISAKVKEGQFGEWLRALEDLQCQNWNNSKSSSKHIREQEFLHSTNNEKEAGQAIVVGCSPEQIGSSKNQRKSLQEKESSSSRTAVEVSSGNPKKHLVVFTATPPTPVRAVEELGNVKQINIEIEQEGGSIMGSSQGICIFQQSSTEIQSEKTLVTGKRHRDGKGTGGASTSNNNLNLEKQSKKLKQNVEKKTRACLKDPSQDA
ncbi:IMP dehydrogenase/GMP reductase [Striga asiatica]|uniref:IMP dehydrogenase/GMP reductase n=1 Tax=Striga asiatica TaxID=4170 RepID=A0A5A7Q184_STRAF|nr:IMP dehydrogenase/GMP reductase [Striga asiatica]